MWVNKKGISFNRGIKRVVFLQTTILTMNLLADVFTMKTIAS